MSEVGNEELDNESDVVEGVEEFISPLCLEGGFSLPIYMSEGVACVVNVTKYKLKIKYVAFAHGNILHSENKIYT